MLWKGAVLFASAALAATSAGALTFEEAIGEAMLSNPDVRAARADARRIHESVPLALSQRLPALRFDSGATATRSIAASGRVDTNRQSIGLSLSQNLYSSGLNTAIVRQAELDVGKSHADLEAVEQRVALNVAAAYSDVLRARRSLRLHERAAETFKAKSEQIVALFRVGDRTKADVAQAEAEWRVAVADLAAARAELDTQRAVLEDLVGRPAAGLEDSPGVGGLPATLESALAAAREDHPSVRAARYGVHSADRAAAAAVGRSGARVDLEGNLSRHANHGLAAPDYTEARVGILFSLPLYRGGSDRARIRQARKTAHRQLLRLQAEQRRAGREAAIAWHALSAARLRRTALSSALDAARVAQRAIQRQADIGERSTREVLDAERNVIDYELAILSAERNISVSSFRLKAAVGALTAKSLGIGNLPDLEREASRTRRKLAPFPLPPFGTD